MIYFPAFTFSRRQKWTKRGVTDTVKGFNREIENVATFQALEGAGRDIAVTVEHISIYRLGLAIILHGTLTGIPGQEGRVGIAICIHCEARWLTGH